MVSHYFLQKPLDWKTKYISSQARTEGEISWVPQSDLVHLSPEMSESAPGATRCGVTVAVLRMAHHLWNRRASFPLARSLSRGSGRRRRLARNSKKPQKVTILFFCSFELSSFVVNSVHWFRFSWICICNRIQTITVTMVLLPVNYAILSTIQFARKYDLWFSG